MFCPAPAAGGRPLCLDVVNRPFRVRQLPFRTLRCLDSATEIPPGPCTFRAIFLRTRTCLVRPALGHRLFSLHQSYSGDEKNPTQGVVADSVPDLHAGLRADQRPLESLSHRRRAEDATRRVDRQISKLSCRLDRTRHRSSKHPMPFPRRRGSGEGCLPSGRWCPVARRS